MQVLLECAVNHDHVVQVHETWLMKPHKMVSTNRSNVAGALQRPEGMNVNSHITVENSPCRLNAGPHANTLSSEPEWRTIWLQPACPKCHLSRAVGSILSSWYDSVPRSLRRSTGHRPSGREQREMYCCWLLSNPTSLHVLEHPADIRQF
jgi:hypothetical protein